MAVSKKIKEFAKTLYLSRDMTGKKQYSLRDISQEIEQNFNKKISYVAISNWAKEGDWNKILQKAVQFGIQQSSDNKISTEEMIIEQASNDLAEVYRYGKVLSQIGTDVLQRAYRPTVEKPKHKTISVRDALMAVRTGAAIMARLNSLINSDTGEAEYGVIYIPDNGRDREN